MIYTQMTMRALLFAYEKHSGQVDKSGIPYIFHPYHLAEQMDDEISTVVALLHDIVEDTNTTFDELLERFPKEAVKAIRYLTRPKDMGYIHYVTKIKENEIATKVKLADLEHNMDESRLMGLQLERHKSLMVKYRKAKEILESK